MLLQQRLELLSRPDGMPLTQMHYLFLQYAGIIISPIAILFMLYALFMYKRRTVQILRRSKVRFDDQQGPVMLVVLLIAAVLASLVLTAYGTLK